MKELAIRQVLERRLAGWAEPAAHHVVFENETAPETGAYLKATLLFAPAAENDICSGEELAGVFQLDILRPAGEGPAEADRIHGELRALFPLDLILDIGGASLMQRSPLAKGPAFQTATHYQVPTSLRFIAYV